MRLHKVRLRLAELFFFEVGDPAPVKQLNIVRLLLQHLGGQLDHVAVIAPLERDAT